MTQCEFEWRNMVSTTSEQIKNTIKMTYDPKSEADSRIFS